MLSHKWGILLLLHQLADSDPVDKQTIRDESHKSPSAYKEPVVLKDAYSSARLSKLRTHDNRTHDTRVIGNGGHSQKDPSNNVHKSVEPEAMNTDKPSEYPEESALLRDLPFTLQGLSSTHLPFPSLSTIDLPPTLPLPVISLLHTLAEPSLLYRVLSDFTQSRDEGLIGQSLRSAISNELRSYLGLIATLEGEIRRALTSVGHNELRGGIGKAGITLKRCVIWTREATMGLRLMSLMAEEVKSLFDF